LLGILLFLMKPGATPTPAILGPICSQRTLQLKEHRMAWPMIQRERTWFCLEGSPSRDTLMTCGFTVLATTSGRKPQSIAMLLLHVERWDLYMTQLMIILSCLEDFQKRGSLTILG